MATLCTRITDYDCLVCNDFFKKPKLLMCGHVLCRNCIVSWLRSNAEALCPLCQDTMVDIQGLVTKSFEEIADTLSDDVAMAELVESAIFLGKKHVCCIHLDKMAMSLCLHCNDTFCQECSNYHRNLPATRHHCVENLATLTVEALAASHRSSCVTHPDKSADVFCSAHHIPICHSCAFLDHRECKDLTDLKAKTDEVQGQLSQFLTMLTDTELSLKHTACKLDQLVLQIDRNTQIEIHTLEEVFSRLQKLVEVSRRRLMEVVENVNTQTKTRVHVVKENLIKHQKRALSHRFLVQRMQKIASDFKLFDMISNLKKCIDNLNLVACIPSELESALCTKLAVDPEMLNFLEQSLNHLRMVPVSMDAKEKLPEVELDVTMTQIITADSGKELMLMSKSTFTEIESKVASTVISAKSSADSPKKKKRSRRRNAKAEPLKKCEISEPLQKCETSKPLQKCETSEPLQKCETSELLGNCETTKPLEKCDKHEPLEKCDKSKPLEECEVIATTVKSSKNTDSRNKKYIYNEGQWSPVNPERKKQYDRDFLILLRGNPQTCIWPAYLEKVPELDLNKIAVGRGAVQHKTLLNLNVHLHKAENPYKPQILLHTVDKDQMKNETLYRQFRAILNKLTQRKFSTLVQKALMLEIYTEERMQGITHLLYEQALSEPTFSVAYANMCKSMIALPNLDEANIQLGPSTIRQKFSQGFGNQDSGSHLQNKTQPLASRLNLLKYLGNDGMLPMGQIPARSNWRDHMAADFGRVTSVNQGSQESDHNKLVDIDK